MCGALNCPGHVDTFLVWDTVTFLLEHLVALLLHVIDGLALPPVLGPALLLGDGVLDRSLGDPTLPLIGIGAHCVGHLLALPLLNSLEGCPGHLGTHLLGHLAAHGLLGGEHTEERGRVELVRQVHAQGQEERRGENNLHVGRRRRTD